MRSYSYEVLEGPGMIDVEKHNKKYYRDLKIFYVLLFVLAFGPIILSKIFEYFG